MKKYIIEYDNGGKVDCMPAVHDSFCEATDALFAYFSNHPFFSFRVQECEIKPSECIANFSEARIALGIKDNDAELKNSSPETRHDASIKLLEHFVKKVNFKHLEALIALNELFTIAEAWNKQDGFVPDFSNENQLKYFPWFTYNDNAAGFVYEDAGYTDTYANASCGSRLCFKSESRAEQFGKQFAHLYNKVFLLNK